MPKPKRSPEWMRCNRAIRAAAKAQALADDDRRAITQPVTCSLTEIAGVIGVGPALRLSAVCDGGETCDVPKFPSPDHALARLLGLKPFVRLCDAYGGQRLDISNDTRVRFRLTHGASKNERIVELKQKGYSDRAIARHLCCSERHVRETLKRRKKRGVRR